MNTTDFKTNYDFSRFNTHYNPIFIADSDKILIYKNDITKIFGTFRLGINIEKYIVPGDIAVMDNCIAEKKTAILSFNSTLKGSKLLFCPLPDDENLFVLSVILSSHLICNLSSGASSKKSHELFYGNVDALKRFEDCLFRLTDCNESNEKYKKLLLRNTQLMSRMERHFNLYVNKIHKFSAGDKKDEDRIVNISHFIKEIYEFSLVPCSSLGYRIFLKCDDDYILVKLNRYSFICTFLSMITLILRVSDNMKLNIHLYENDNKAIFAFSFESENLMSKAKCLEGELQFIIGAAKMMGWNVEQYADPRNPASITALISFEKNTGNDFLVNSVGDDYRFRGGIQYYAEIIDSELAILYDHVEESE